MVKSFHLFFIGILPWAVYCAPRIPAQEAAINFARTCLMQQHYETADSIVRLQSKSYPEDLEALYMRCTIRQTRILDYESYAVDGKEYLDFADSVLQVLLENQKSQKGQDSVAALFFIGSVLGGKGIILAKNGKWPLAIRYALRSVGYFKQVLALDTTYYAAYYGIGVFNYYLSQNLKWVPFFGDKRIEALHQIKIATTAPIPYNFAADNSLGWIFIERGEFGTADSIVSHVLSQFPDNTLFLRIKVRADLGLGRYELSATHARRLIELSLRKQPKNWADIVSGYQALVCSYDNLHLENECFNATSTALRLEIPEAYRKISFVKRHFAYIAEMRKKHEKRLLNDVR
jgi:hypothetical protein